MVAKRLKVSKGRHVGLLKHFLKGRGLPLKNAGQSAGTYNALLRQAGKAGRLVETNLKTKAGKKPWVAAKKISTDLHKCLQNMSASVFTECFSIVFSDNPLD